MKTSTLRLSIKAGLIGCAVMVGLVATATA